jgi:hypothetical protein
MENVALQNQLQAISLGASLAQRAIENRRIQQQMAVQAGEQLMRQRSQELQMRVQENALAQSLKEQEAMNTEFDAFNLFNQQVADFLNNPDPQGKIPQAPVFKSKTYQQEAFRAIQGLDQYSARARAMKAADSARIQADKFDADLIADAVKYGAFQIDPETGFPKRGPNGVPIIDIQALRTKQEEDRTMRRRKDEALLAGGVSNTKIQNAIDSLAKQGLVDMADQEAVAEASNIIRTGAKVPSKTLSSMTAADNAAMQMDSALQRISQFNQKYGDNAFNEYVGPIDAPVFRLRGKYSGLSGEEQKEARLIQQQIAKVIQDYRKDVFGATLTANEERNMNDVVGTARGNDYVLLSKGFSDTLKSALTNQSKTYRYYPDVPSALKRRYSPEIFVSETVVRPPAQPAPSGGFKIENIEVLP